MSSLASAGANLPSEADTVIIGGGIMGLGTAYHLARLQRQRVVVLEGSYLCSGASGRNGGGVRAQWSSETNIALMKESLAICSNFATKMRINTWFRRGGYLFLARSADRAQQLEASAALQRGHGLPTQLLDAKAAAKVVPGLDTTGLVVASYNPDDAVVFPWPFLFGYAKAALAEGAQIFTHTPVTAIETDGRRVTKVITPFGEIRCRQVIVAAGARSPELTRMVGVELPSHPHRHEICSTEPLKPFLGPLVAELASGLYFSQSTRGEIVGGISNAQVPDGMNQDSSLRFLGLYARALTAAMPRLGGVRVLRQWAGVYDLTPDGNPLLGRVDEVEGLVLTSGFMGHGFMMAPVITRMLAEHLTSDAHVELFERWNLRRYRTGKLLTETMILG